MAWTRVAERTSPGFIYAMVLGGFGAPLFLFLAGVSVGTVRRVEISEDGRLHESWRAVQKRGWQIFGLAFLFRLQSFILTGGYSAIGLLKVDILNVMGPAIALAALAGERRGKAARAADVAVCGNRRRGIAMLTPIVRVTPLLNWLPDPVEWYFRPSPTRTNFTLFPWAGFVFAGARVGEVIDGARCDTDTRCGSRLALAAAGVGLAVCGLQRGVPAIDLPAVGVLDQLAYVFLSPRRS